LNLSRDNASAIGSRGGILSTLEICQGGTSGSQGYVAAVLRNLAKFNEIKENFVEENDVLGCFVRVGFVWYWIGARQCDVDLEY